MKSLKHFLISIFIFFSFNSIICAQITHNQSDKKIIIKFVKPHQINNVFNYTSSIKQWKETLIYIYDGNNENSFQLKKNVLPDNIILTKNSEYIVLRHYINYFDFCDYILKAGDTISIDYKNGMPNVTVENRKTSFYDYTFENYVYYKYIKSFPSAIGKYFGVNDIYLYQWFNAPNLLKLKKLSPEQITLRKDTVEAKIKEQLLSECIKFIELSLKTLDSIKNKNLISQMNYDFYGDKYRTIKNQILIENNMFTSQDIYKLLSKYEDITSQYPNIFHQQLVNSIVDKFYTKSARYIALKDGINRDYRTVFDELLNSTMFPSGARKLLLTRELNRIAQAFTDEDFLLYYKKYEKAIKDTLLLNTIKEKYKIEFSEFRNNVSALIVNNIYGKVFTFEEIKEQNLGKVIYVDFWASWCAPCRAAFESSHKLRNKFLGKDIVFVYFSIDQIHKAWEQAVNREKLASHEDSYIIINFKSSSFIKQFELSSIPRYMIFNKSGSLIYPNAPSPQDENLENLLVDLLKQE